MTTVKCHATREDRMVVMGKEAEGSGTDNSMEGSLMEIGAEEERKLLGIEGEEVLKERKYIHAPDPEEETVEALKGEIRSLNRIIERQKRRRLNGKRNLWVRVTNKKRYVKDEGRRETGGEKAKRRVEEDKERRTREKRKK